MKEHRTFGNFKNLRREGDPARALDRFLGVGLVAGKACFPSIVRARMVPKSAPRLVLSRLELMQPSIDVVESVA
jgi:hypothetical protein